MFVLQLLLMLRLKKSTSYDCFITFVSLLQEQEVKVSPDSLGIILFIVHLLQIILADFCLEACIFFLPFFSYVFC